MKSLLKLIICLTLLISLISCEKDQQVVYFIDNDLLSYFDDFKKEAAERNVQIDYELLGIEGYIRTITSGDVVGQCVHNSIDPDQVVIDRDYWNGASAIEKEFIVFHELGHCALGRSHLDTKNPDGTCISMMNSGKSNCQDVYSESTRENYLDELFSN